MVLEEETTIVQSRTAHTQYLIIPAAMVRDSQYPFKEGEKVRIIIDTYRKMMIVRSVEEPQVKVSLTRSILKGRKYKSLKDKTSFLAHG